jgi:hypothetical protein
MKKSVLSKVRRRWRKYGMIIAKLESMSDAKILKEGVRVGGKPNLFQTQDTKYF